MKGYSLLPIVVVFFANSGNIRCQHDNSTHHHRVRRFIFTKDSQVSFDLELMIPIPMLGSIDVKAIFGIPLTVTMQNDTFTWNPISIPYIVMPPPPEPIAIPLPAYPPPVLPNHYPSYNPYQNQYQQQSYAQPNPYPQQPNAYQNAAMDPSHQASQRRWNVQPYQRSFVPQSQTSNEQQQQASQENEKLHNYVDPNLFHHRMQRHTRAAANIHRLDLFTSLASSLSEYGLDGKSCILQSICQLAQAPLLIETPLHEVLEHILTVSRGHDEDSLMMEYFDAETQGRSHADCKKVYDGCGYSFFTEHEMA
ncbi:hypothetical protein HDE_02976 [Halotydeus destructor]|nr:hypothetical protein HDE_02976 [Halotydeus destructor]